MNFLQRRRRRRRCPALPVLSLSEAVHGESGSAAWDARFEEEWVRCLLDLALPRVEERSRPNAKLLRHLLATPGVSASDLALMLGIDKGGVPLRLHRARRMLAEEVWNAVQHTVTSQRELEEERASLGRALEGHLQVSGVPKLFHRSGL